MKKKKQQKSRREKVNYYYCKVFSMWKNEVSVNVDDTMFEPMSGDCRCHTWKCDENKLIFRNLSHARVGGLVKDFSAK